MKKIVVLASFDFTLAFKLKNAIIDNFAFDHVTPNHLTLLKHNIIFCSSGERDKIKHSRVVELNPNSSELQLKTKVIQAMEIKLNGPECIIGIDPGNAIGVCILFNQIIIETTVFYSKEKLVNWIRTNIGEISGNNVIIKIGDGGGKNREEIIKSLKNSVSDQISFEIIDEKNTSHKITSNLTSHEQAAIRIAKRKGYRI